jgi:hypothetical protein
MYSQPFPRSRSRQVVTPAYREGDSIQDAKDAWFAWLRIVGNLRQFQVPPGHRVKE